MGGALLPPYLSMGSPTSQAGCWLLGGTVVLLLTGESQDRAKLREMVAPPALNT